MTPEERKEVLIQIATAITLSLRYFAVSGEDDKLVEMTSHLLSLPRLDDFSDEKLLEFRDGLKG